MMKELKVVAVAKADVADAVAAAAAVVINFQEAVALQDVQAMALVKHVGQTNLVAVK
jgi:hypothetical protein